MTCATALPGNACASDIEPEPICSADYPTYRSISAIKTCWEQKFI